MIDLTETLSRAQIIYGMGLIILLLLYIAFYRHPPYPHQSQR